MEKKFWNSKWNKNEIGFHQSNITYHLEKYISKFNNSEKSCLIPLCGKSNDITFLSKCFKKVVGIEFINKAIIDYFKENNFAYEKLNDTYCHKNIKLINKDFLKYDNEEEPINYIFDRAALIALPHNSRKKYTDKLKSITPKDSLIFLITIEYDQTLTKGPPFSVPHEEILQLYDGRNIELKEERKILSPSPKFAEKEITQRVYFIKN